MKKNVLITGGTRGIGAAIALEFKKLDYSVAVTYLYDDESSIQFSQTHQISIFKWDVANYRECEKGVIDVVNFFGRPIDILVNNAGITRDGMLHKQEYENWTVVLRTNLDSMFNMSRQVIGPMREQRFGRIINISSVNAYGMYGQTNYAASKAGIIGFTKALALESATNGITVNAVAPGYINTDMVAKVPKEFLETKILTKIPIGRLGEPCEIAHIVRFLASEDAALITGQVIDANGGLHM